MGHGGCHLIVLDRRLALVCALRLAPRRLMGRTSASSLRANSEMRAVEVEVEVACAPEALEALDGAGASRAGWRSRTGCERAARASCALRSLQRVGFRPHARILPGCSASTHGWLRSIGGENARVAGGHVLAKSARSSPSKLEQLLVCSWQQAAGDILIATAAPSPPWPELYSHEYLGMEATCGSPLLRLKGLHRRLRRLRIVTEGAEEPPPAATRSAAAAVTPCSRGFSVAAPGASSASCAAAAWAGPPASHGPY